MADFIDLPGKWQNVSTQLNQSGAFANTLSPLLRRQEPGLKHSVSCQPSNSNQMKICNCLFYIKMIICSNVSDKQSAALH